VILHTSEGTRNGCSIVGGTAWGPTLWRTVQQRRDLHYVAVWFNEDLYGLSWSVESFEQLVEHRIGAGEIQHILG
jgi:hypothetical protein